MWPDVNFLALFPWQPDKVVCELCFDENGSLIDKLNLDKESQIYPIANHSTGPTWVKWLLYAETWDTVPMALSQEMPAPEEPEVVRPEQSLTCFSSCAWAVLPCEEFQWRGALDGAVPANCCPRPISARVNRCHYSLVSLNVLNVFVTLRRPEVAADSMISTIDSWLKKKLLIR